MSILTSIFNLLKKIPWWGWVAIVIFIVIMWQSATGAALARKLYKSILDDLRADQTRIVETLEETVTQREQEIAELQKQVADIQKKRAIAETESARLRGLVRDKDLEIAKLKKERDALIIPDDLNALADEFRRRGYKPRVILPGN